MGVAHDSASNVNAFKWNALERNASNQSQPTTVESSSGAVNYSLNSPHYCMYIFFPLMRVIHLLNPQHVYQTIGNSQMQECKGLRYDKHIPGPVMARLLPIGYKPMDNDSRKVGVWKVK